MNKVTIEKINILEKDGLFSLTHHMEGIKKSESEHMQAYHQAHIEIALEMLTEANRLKRLVA